MAVMIAVEKTLRWIVIAGIFALPVIALIIANGLFFPYITGKNFAFRVVVEIIVGAWLALALVIPKYRPRRSWVLASFALFVLILGVANAQGAYPFKSFWSNYERMDGWITIAHTLLFLVVSVSVLNTENLWRRFFQWSLIVSAFLSALGLLQVAGILTLGSGGTGLVARVDATFGNPIYFAVYMLFHVFIAALLWAQEGIERWNLRERLALPAALLVPVLIVIFQKLPFITDVAQKAAFVTQIFLVYALLVIVIELFMLGRRMNLLAFLIVLDSIALFFSGTRGAMIGLIGGTLLALILYALSGDASRRMRQLSVAVFAALIIVGGGLWLARDTAAVRSVGFLSRLSSISLTDSTTKARFLNMGMAWEGVKERPILGWGQENYALVFDKYYDPRMYAQEQWFDRVHSSVFDWWIAGGTLGLLSYLAIFAAILWALWRPSVERGSIAASMPHVKKGVFTTLERSILTGLLAGYVFHNLTVFDNVTSYILFAMILGYIAYRESTARNAPLLYEREILPRGALSLVAAVAAVGVWGGAWAINANALSANKAIIAAITPQGDISKNLASFEKAIAMGSYGTQEAREQLAQIAMQIPAATNVSNDLKAKFVQTAVRELDLQAKQSPLDARFPLFAGTVLGAAGDYSNAATELARAHELSTHKQTILYALAQNAILRGDGTAMLTYFQSAYNLYTDNLDARLYYAAALIGAGQEAEADAILAPVVATGQAADPRITNAYVARKEYNKLIPIWQAYIKVNPSDVQSYFTLAAVYYAAYQTAAAIEELRLVGTLAPDEKARADQYIQQIQNGTLKLGQ